MDGEYEVVPGYDEKGFSTLKIVYTGASSVKQAYDDRGFLITPGPAQPTAAGQFAEIHQVKANSAESSAAPAAASDEPNGAPRSNFAPGALLGSLLISSLLFLFQF